MKNIFEIFLKILSPFVSFSCYICISNKKERMCKKMRRKRNKIVTLVLSLIMALTLAMPVSARDYQLTEEADLEYCTDFHEFEVYDFFHDLHDHLEIPTNSNSSCFHWWVENPPVTHTELGRTTCGACRGTVTTETTVTSIFEHCRVGRGCEAVRLKSRDRSTVPLSCSGCSNPFSVPQDDLLW